ncbi:HlyD family efflux transporter periplasmic adaptor subunit [Massilia sp. H-1]|nr:HlyD family efflux transporter periplasmic adaptor subunit [Massilia sp. H-1]
MPRRRGRRARHHRRLRGGRRHRAAVIWHYLPKGLAVEARDVRIASVASGAFIDDIVVRANAEPLQSVLLDSVESGRVEEVFAKDGAMLKKGALMFRLSNPQRNLELLARQAEHAQQISNLSNLRVAHQDSLALHTRRVQEIEFALSQQEKLTARQSTLAAQGFISSVALQEAKDQLAQQREFLRQEHASFATTSGVRRTAVTQLEGAIGELDTGLRLVSETVKALTVRAPADGRLTGFRLQIGETVKIDQRIGRIDDPSQFKVTAQVDEFYLSRITQGQARPAQRRHRQLSGGRLEHLPAGQGWPLHGRDGVCLKRAAATISPGQGFDIRITLGAPKQALLLPNGAFVNDSGGAWVFVVAPDGSSAQRRAVRTGRRSPAQIEVLSGLKPGEKVITSSYTKFGKAETLQLNK